jgi:hypothetical protein
MLGASPAGDLPIRTSLPIVERFPMRLARTGRAVVAGGAALGLFLGAAACGAEVDRAKLVSKLKSEADLKDLTDTQIECVADVLIKHGRKRDVVAYSEGKKDIEDVKGDSEEEAGKDAAKCVTGK